MNTFNESLLDGKKELEKLFEGNHPHSEEIIPFLQSIAAQGNLVTQKIIGFLYFHGKSVEQNYFEAFRWYKLAASQGDADAQYWLALMFQEGKGTEHSDENALKY